MNDIVILDDLLVVDEEPQRQVRTQSCSSTFGAVDESLKRLGTSKPPYVRPN